MSEIVIHDQEPFSGQNLTVLRKPCKSAAVERLLCAAGPQAYPIP